MALCTATGADIQIQGEVTIDSEEVGRVSFIVCDGLSHDALLGADVLSSAVIDCQGKTLTINSKRLPIHAVDVEFVSHVLLAK